MTGIVKIKNLGSLVHCLLSYPKNPFLTLMGIEAEPSAGSILSGISQSAGFTPDAFTLTRTGILI